MTDETSKAALPQTPAPDPTVAPAQREGHVARRTWLRVTGWIKRIVGAVTMLSTVLFAVWVIELLVSSTLRGHTLDLQSISVPKSLADEGFTAPVTTQRLRDAINAIYGRINARVAQTALVLRQNPPDIAIPSADISVESAATWLREMLPAGWRHDVSGEFTQSGATLMMRVRLNGQVILTESASGPNAVDTLIGNGAFKLVETTEPLVAAVHLFNSSDLDGAESVADRMISTLAPDDKVVGKAYTLKGAIAQQRYDTDKRSKDSLERQRFLVSAIAEYQEANRVAPDYPEAYLGLGNIWHKLGQETTALSEYRQALRLDPGYVQARSGLADALDATGRKDEAIAEYRNAVAFDGKDEVSHNNLGNLLYDLHRIDEAVLEYGTAIRLDSNDAGPHNGLGNAWEKLGRHDDAISEYGKAIRIDPKYALAHNGLGEVLRQQGDLNAAATEFRSAILLDPDLAAPHVGLGAISDQQGNESEALDEFQTALQLDPTESNGHLDLGIMLMRQGKLDEAIAQYQAVLVLDPNSAKAHNSLGILGDDKGRFDDARAEYRKAMLLDDVCGAALQPWHASARRT